MSGVIRFLSLCGMLGYGFPADGLRRALEQNLDFIGIDAGSTDPGPYYLGSGNAFVKDPQVRRDLGLALEAAVGKGIPLIIGSGGGSGARAHVDHFVDILLELARAKNFRFKLAVIYSDIESHVITTALEKGRISPCGPVPALTPEAIARLTNPVAQMGTAPIAAALRQGADVVVAGRACDTAIFAALPIMRGFDPGLALHCAKIAECGALCARPAGANDSLLCTLAHDHFIVEPVNQARRCTPDSVAAHSLYEQPDPNCFYEPEGMIDMNGSVFEQMTQNAVKVSGTVLRPAARKTLKLEGVELKGYRAITIAGMCDPVAIAGIDVLQNGVREAVAMNLRGIIEPSDYTLLFRRYGLDATTFVKPLAKATPNEIGLLVEAIAPTQELADTIVSLARSTAMHQPFPGRKATAGNLAFPFSPSDVPMGPAYEFCLYHLLEVADPQALFAREIVRVDGATVTAEKKVIA